LFSYPLSSSQHLAERVEQVPSQSPARRWVLRDDNQRHHHGVVKLSESPLYVELLWKADARSQEQLVGRYRLNLPGLLAEDYVRYERADADGSPSDEVRLRFYRGDRGVVYIQVRADGPALAVGTVDRSD
jgi:hypothetical protein